MKITTVNFKSCLDIETNINNIKSILDKYIDSDIIVFPEASLQGYMPFLEKESVSYNLDCAIDLSLNHVFINYLKDFSSKNNQIIILGLIEIDESVHFGEMYDSALVILPDKSHKVYRKTHQATNEHYFLFPGNSLDVFDTPLGKIGFLICYDKCFPEAGRTLAIKGAEIIIIISAWGYSHVNMSEVDKLNDLSKQVFDTYDQVRAVENQCLVIVSNQVGTNEDNTIQFLGSSKIISPNGKILGQLGDTESELTLDVDLRASIIEERVLNLNALNLLRNRRPEIYS